MTLKFTLLEYFFAATNDSYEITDVNIWSSLTDKVHHSSETCTYDHFGDLFSWSDVSSEMEFYGASPEVPSSCDGKINKV